MYLPEMAFASEVKEYEKDSDLEIEGVANNVAGTTGHHEYLRVAALAAATHDIRCHSHALHR